MILTNCKKVAADSDDRPSSGGAPLLGPDTARLMLIGLVTEVVQVVAVPFVYASRYMS